MEHSIQGNQIIIEEAHSFPAAPVPVRNRKRVYVLVLLAVLAFFKSEAVKAQSPPEMAPTQDQVNKDASRRTVRLAYKLDPEKTKATGIFLSSDTAALIAPGQATRYRTASFDETSQSYRADFDGLEPDSRYFY